MSGPRVMRASFGYEKVMPRQARLDSPGTLHHVMIRGIEKRRIVDDDWDRTDLCDDLGESGFVERILERRMHERSASMQRESLVVARSEVVGACCLQ
jgi:hypothetical protein